MAKALSKGTPYCFVIMPFGGWFDNYYSEIYEPAIKKAGYDAFREDEHPGVTMILEDIVKHVKGASVVLADLTTLNPNVFYELGIAHAYKKPAVLICDGTDNTVKLPFDVSPFRTIFFDKNDPIWGTKLIDKITEKLDAIKKDPDSGVPKAFGGKLPTPDETPLPNMSELLKKIYFQEVAMRAARGEAFFPSQNRPPLFDIYDIFREKAKGTPEKS